MFFIKYIICRYPIPSYTGYYLILKCRLAKIYCPDVGLHLFLSSHSMIKSIFSFGNKRFFRLIDQLAENIQAMSHLFNETATSSGDMQDQQVRKLEEKEAAVSELLGELRVELGHNLTSPFDREDIHYLAADLKYMAGNMLHIVRQMRNYMIFETPEITKSIAAQNLLTVEKLCTILRSLSDTGKLTFLAGICMEIKQVLYRCDDQLDKATAEAVNMGRDGVALVKIMDHFTALDRLLERMGDTVNVCENIIVKYS